MVEEESAIPSQTAVTFKHVSSVNSFTNVHNTSITLLQHVFVNRVRFSNTEFD